MIFKMQQENDTIKREVQTKCRICLCQNEESVNIFSYDAKCGKIWMAVMECGSVQVEDGDHLPSIICLSCLENLRKAYEFRSLCLLSDQTLRHYLTFIELQCVNNIQNSQNLKSIAQSYIITPQTVKQDAITQYLQPLNQINVLNNQICTTDEANQVTVLQTNLQELEPTGVEQAQLQITSIQSAQNTLTSPQYHTFLTPSNTEEHFIDLPVEIEVEPATFTTETFQIKPSNDRLEQTESNEIVQNQNASDNPRRRKKISRNNQSKNSTSGKRNRDYKPNLTGKYSCRICSKRYDTDKQLIRHENVTHGERRFKCDQCNKRFTEKSVLKSHMMAIHTGERPYKCQFCDKSYIAKNHLRVHIRVHTGERPYKCDQCEKSFGQQNVLRDHRASHAGLRPHQCKVCARRFIRFSHLARHTDVVHKDGKWNQETKNISRPHECHFCGKSYSRKDHLIRHIASHNGHRPYKCSLCEKTFVRKWDVKRHMIVHKDGHVTVIVPPIVAQAAIQQIDAS